ncbi:MAG: GTPase HflX, partial [Nitrosospira sp.]|nr:GTPase HflX [Nitrosospira sp.]
MLDHPTGNLASANSAVLVNLDFSSSGHAESLNELRQLASSDALEISAGVHGKRVRPDPALFAGTGKIDEIAWTLEQTGASLVIFNHDLSPAQQRNLERRLECRVID